MMRYLKFNKSVSEQRRVVSEDDIAPLSPPEPAYSRRSHDSALWENHWGRDAILWTR